MKIIARIAMGTVALALMAGCATQAPKEEPGITIVQSKRGAALAMSDKVLFDVGKAEVKPESGKALDTVAKILNSAQYAQRKVYVEGHTDSTGSEEGNLRLSVARAQAVKAQLVARKVDPARLTSEGFAASEPVAPNDTAEGRAKNRRVEVVFPQETLDNLRKGVDSAGGLGAAIGNMMEGIKGVFK